MAPQLQCWLQLPDEYRIKQLSQWKQGLCLIDQTINTLLPLIRNNEVFKKETLDSQAFFQTNLANSDKEKDLYLIRIKMHQADIYPEISVGKHRLVIRFLTTYNQAPIEKNNMNFEWMASQA